jgi:hypothetical protein
MITALGMEFYKTRRRKVWLVVGALIGAQLLWALWSLTRMDAQDLSTGWQYCLYQFPLLNSIMMPVIAAVVASRLCDVEHKGQTLRLLETVMPAGRLFDVKFLCGAGYILAAALLQVLVMLITGLAAGFPGEVPADMLGFYLLFTTAVSLTILLFQQVLSLLFTNQMVPLSVGLVGSFAGLFSMFFPEGFQKFLLWSYYGVLMFVRMDWDPETRISNFYWTSIDWSGLVSLAVFFCVIYIVGRVLFVKKEL